MKVSDIRSVNEALEALVRVGGVPVAVYILKPDGETELLLTAYTEADFRVGVKSAIELSPVGQCRIGKAS